MMDKIERDRLRALCEAATELKWADGAEHDCDALRAKLEAAEARIERLRASVEKRDRLLSTGCGIKLTAEEYTWWDGSGWGGYHKAKRYATHDEAVAALAGTDGRGCCIAGFPSIVEVPHPLEAEVARLREQARLSYENGEARIAALESEREEIRRATVEAIVARLKDEASHAGTSQEHFVVDDAASLIEREFLTEKGEADGNPS